MVRLNSLLLVEEKILEADYFACRMSSLCFDEFRYEFNAYLSAARSITFLLKKEMHEVAGFNEWWAKRQEEMRSDASMKFFLELRNFSQKEGRISMVGTPSTDSERNSFWCYRFAGNKWAVPAQLLHRDVVECCSEHLSKLACIVLACAEAFPYHCCPRRAVTPEGLEALGLNFSDIESILGLPKGSTDVAGIPKNHVYRILQNHLDGVDFEEIQRVADNKPERTSTLATPSDQLNKKLAHALVNSIESSRP